MGLTFAAKALLVSQTEPVPLPLSFLQEAMPIKDRIIMIDKAFVMSSFLLINEFQCINKRKKIDKVAPQIAILSASLYY